MSLLAIYHQDHPENAEVIRDREIIRERLNGIGALFESWDAAFEFEVGADQETILRAYQEQVERLKGQFGFQSADVISVTADHPQKTELRAKFLNEHTHSDFEVRFFVEGRGLFYLHPDDQVYAILCEQGDLLSVPSNVKHWFDMGAEPHLKCIRLFTTPEGWVANFTGSSVSEAFLPLEAFAEAHQ